MPAESGGVQLSAERVLEHLRRPSSYPRAAGWVEERETHTSRLFLTRDRVYKLKKPVRLGQLDLRSPLARRSNCQREVRLNRRLAASIYLGVLTLNEAPGGRLELGGAGRPLDWLVVMRRLRADAMLDRELALGAPTRRSVQGAASRLARFFLGADVLPIAPTHHLAWLRSETLADLRALENPRYGLPAEWLADLEATQLAQLDERPEAFAARAAAGRVLDGHGDLRPEHVCLRPEPLVIDCLEFDADLRAQDPLDELALLGLECELLGAPEVGAWFLAEHERASGDRAPAELLAFYRRFRALRRARLAAWHLDEPVTDPERWRRRARSYLELARG